MKLAIIYVQTINTSFQFTEKGFLAWGQAHPSPVAIYSLRKYLSRAHTFTNGYIRVYTFIIGKVRQYVLRLPDNARLLRKFGVFEFFSGRYGRMGE